MGAASNERSKTRVRCSFASFMFPEDRCPVFPCHRLRSCCVRGQIPHQSIPRPGLSVPTAEWSALPVIDRRSTGRTAGLASANAAMHRGGEGPLSPPSHHLRFHASRSRWRTRVMMPDILDSAPSCAEMTGGAGKQQCSSTDGGVKRVRRRAGGCVGSWSLGLMYVCLGGLQR